MRWKISLFLLGLGVVIAFGLTYYVLIRQVTVAKPSQNHPPKMKLLYPKAGKELAGVVKISWSTVDTDGDILTITIQYTSDPLPFCPSCPPQKWYNIAIGVRNDGSFQWDTTILKNGRYILKIIVSDGTHTSEDNSGWTTINNR